MAAGPLLVSEPLQRYRRAGPWRAIPCGAARRPAAHGPSLRGSRASMPTCWRFPRSIRTGRRIDWYAPFEGEARKLSDLSEAEARLRSWTRSTACTGEGSRVSPTRWKRRNVSSAERNFARLPAPCADGAGRGTRLYIVDGKPVMTFWGFSADAALPGVFLASPPPAPRSAVGRTSDSRGPFSPRRPAPSSRQETRIGVVAVGCCSACC